MKTVYFIPSNRNLKTCITSYVKEILFAKKKYGINIPMVIPESNNHAFVKDNRKIINSLMKEYSEIEILHLTIEVQQKYFDSLLNGKNRDFKDMFLTQYTDYGNCMNKLFLMTCSLGAEGLHRRDSDTRLIFDEFEAPEAYPIEFELKYLGAKVRNCTEIKVRESNTSVIERDIWVVGSNYFGEWNLDVRDFAYTSFNYIYRLYELLGFPKNDVKEICDTAFQFDQKFQARDNLTLVTSVLDGLNPDCGNVAIYKLHEILPNLPGKSIMAADYFSFDTATALGIPSIHHTRDVFHEYKPNAFNLEQKIKYWEGVCKFADYFNLYMEIYNTDLDASYESNRIELISPEIVRNICEKISTFPNVSIQKRVDRLNAIANEVLIPFDNQYAKVGEHILSHSKRIIGELNTEYSLHTKLIQSWAGLVESAKSVDLRSIVRKM